MLNPLTRAPCTLARPILESLAPPLVSLRSHLPALPKTEKINFPTTATLTDSAPGPSKIVRTYQASFPARPSYSGPVIPKVFGLYGMRNTREIIGSTVLRYVIGRDFSSSTNSKTADSGVKSEVVAQSGSGQAGVSEKLIAEKESLYVLTQRGEFYILSVLCGTWGYFDYDTALTDDEISKALADTAFVEQLARKIQSDPFQYRYRKIQWP
jgi:hypothetical protein